MLKGRTQSFASWELRLLGGSGTYSNSALATGAEGDAYLVVLDAEYRLRWSRFNAPRMQSFLNRRPPGGSGALAYPRPARDRCAMSDELPDTDKLRHAVRELAEALETMLNLLKADAIPRTPEAMSLIRRAITTLGESGDLLTNPVQAGEFLPLAAAINTMTVAAREQILDDAVAASPVPDHPPL